MKQTKTKVAPEEAVQQKELQLTENNSEQQEQQNMTNQNQSQIQNQTNDERKSQTTESDVGSNDGCDPSYPDICITTYSEKLAVLIYLSETLRCCHQIPTVLILIAMVWVAKDK